MNFSYMTSASATIVLKPVSSKEPIDRDLETIDVQEAHFTCNEGHHFLQSKINGKDFLETESLTWLSMNHYLL